MEDPTLVIDIIVGNQLASLGKENSSSSNSASSYFCVLKFNGKEIGRTEPSADSFDPSWYYLKLAALNLHSLFGWSYLFSGTQE